MHPCIDPLIKKKNPKKTLDDLRQNIVAEYIALHCVAQL